MRLFNNSEQSSYEKCKNRDGILKHSTKAKDLLSNSPFCNTNISPEHICLSSDEQKCCKDTAQEDCLEISKCNSKYDSKLNKYLNKQDFTLDNTVCHNTIILIWNILTNSLLSNDKADLSLTTTNSIKLSKLINNSSNFPFNELNKFIDDCGIMKPDKSTIYRINLRCQLYKIKEERKTEIDNNPYLSDIHSFIIVKFVDPSDQSVSYKIYQSYVFEYSLKEWVSGEIQQNKLTAQYRSLLEKTLLKRIQTWGNCISLEIIKLFLDTFIKLVIEMNNSPNNKENIDQLSDQLFGKTLLTDWICQRISLKNINPGIEILSKDII